MTRQRSQAMPMETARDESCGRGAPLRILVLDTSPACHFTVVTTDDHGDLIQKVDITEATLSELEHNKPDDWDIVITHVHDAAGEGKPLMLAAAGPGLRRRGLAAKRVLSAQSVEATASVHSRLARNCQPDVLSRTADTV